MTSWKINYDVRMIIVIFIFLFIGNMIIFVITRPMYIRDRNSEEIDVGELLLASFIASAIGVVFIWVVIMLFRG